MTNQLKPWSAMSTIERKTKQRVYYAERILQAKFHMNIADYIEKERALAVELLKLKLQLISDLYSYVAG